MRADGTTTGVVGDRLGMDHLNVEPRRFHRDGAGVAHIGVAMYVVRQFLHSWSRLKPTVGAGPLSLHDRTAKAVAHTLRGVRGSAICLDNGGTRLAVGVSDGHALLAEQLEYTIGDGPGLAAIRTAPTLAAGDHFARRWPIFHEALTSHTEFRAARVVPLTEAGTEWPATLLLFYSSLDGARCTPDADIADVAHIVGSVVACSTISLDERLHLPRDQGTWDHIHRRLAVDVAVGMIRAAHRIAAADALDVLRGYAYSHDQIIDDAAGRLITGELQTTTI